MATHAGSVQRLIADFAEERDRDFLTFKRLWKAMQLSAMHHQTGEFLQVFYEETLGKRVFPKMPCRISQGALYLRSADA